LCCIDSHIQLLASATARRFSNLAQLRRKPLTVLPTTTLVENDDDRNDNNNQDDLEAAAHDNYGSNKESTMGSFESCKREAAALERLLEDKVSRYQQVGQQFTQTAALLLWNVKPSLLG
jgi:hypothetical protein